MIKITRKEKILQKSVTISKVHLSIMVKNTVKSQDQDHQKGKDTREVGYDLCKVLLTIMLKNTVNSIKLFTISEEKYTRPQLA